MSKMSVLRAHCRRRRITAAAALTLAMATVAFATCAAAAPITGEIILVLEKAIGQGDGKDLELTAECRDGTARMLWGVAENYNASVHDGIVRQATITDDAIELQFDMLVNKDPFVWGGWASYTVRVSRADVPVRACTGEEGYYVSDTHHGLNTGLATGLLEGTFSGVFDGPKERQSFSGRAVGIVLPLVEPPDGFVPPAENEHPRLLFRKSELPAMKARLKTPFGQALLGEMSRSGDIVAQAMAYQLTGDLRFAGTALQAALDGILSKGAGMDGNEILKTLYWGGRSTQIALLYDLCYDALTPEDKARLEDYMSTYGRKTTYKPWNFCDPHSHMLLDHGCPHVIGLYPGGGMVSLALYNKKAPRPEEPAKPVIKEVPDPPPPFMGKAMIERMKEQAATAKAAYAERLKEWEYECSLWDENDGSEVNMLRLLRHSYAHMSANIRHGIGEGGFKGSSESHVALWYPLLFQYAIAYRNVIGEPVTGRQDVDRFVQRYITTTVFGEPAADGRMSGASQGFGGGSEFAGPLFTSQAMALCPPEHRPVILWYWLKLLGVTPEEVSTPEGAKKIAERSGQSGVQGTPGLNLLTTFAYFPIDPETGKLSMEPKNPAEVLPHVLETKTHGLYVFRNGWNGPDDVVAQTFAMQAPYMAWGLPDTADIQIYGFGHAWFEKASTGARTYRVMGNVVNLPLDLVTEFATGDVTYFKGDSKTGSGTVTINLDRVYAGHKYVPVLNEDGTPRVSSGNGLPVMQSVPDDTGIRGLRAFAADYSGKAGVPALFVIVDRITGGQTKEWYYHVPGGGRRGAPTEVALDKNGFKVTLQGAPADSAWMNVTFVAPGPLKIERVKGTRDVGTAKHGAIVTAPIDAVVASGEDPTAGEFLAIVTLQKGAAPEVTAAGSGLAAKVTVGGQTISFDGEKIVLGQ